MISDRIAFVIFGFSDRVCCSLEPTPRNSPVPRGQPLVFRGSPAVASATPDKYELWEKRVDSVVNCFFDEGITSSFGILDLILLPESVVCRLSL